MPGLFFKALGPPRSNLENIIVLKVLQGEGGVQALPLD